VHLERVHQARGRRVPDDRPVAVHRSAA
jgi:hypothetical protein